MWEQTIALPAKLAVDLGTNVGPGTVSFSDPSGLTYSGSLSPLRADWFGNKSVIVPLSRTPTSEGVVAARPKSDAGSGTSGGHRKRFVLLALLAVVAIAGIDLGARFLVRKTVRETSGTPEVDGDTLRLDGSALASRMTSAKEKLSGDEAMIRDAIAEHLSCI